MTINRNYVKKNKLLVKLDILYYFNILSNFKIIERFCNLINYYI